MSVTEWLFFENSRRRGPLKHVQHWLNAAWKVFLIIFAGLLLYMSGFLYAAWTDAYRYLCFGVAEYVGKRPLLQGVIERCTVAATLLVFFAISIVCMLIESCRWLSMTPEERRKDHYRHDDF